MTRGLSLDCLTLPDVTPTELIRIAAEAGYQAVSLWVQPPALFAPMLADPTMEEEIARTLFVYGVSLGNLEVFNLNTDDPVECFEPAIAFGARLGARTATAIDYGPRRTDMTKRLARFDAICARNAIVSLFEPIDMGNIRTVEEGVALIEAAGVATRLVVDCLHLMRTETTIDRLRAIPTDRIGHVQLCDGLAVVPADQREREATADRLYPGEGSFPLAEIIFAVPSSATLAIEAPSLRRQCNGISPVDRACEALRVTRQFVT